MKAFDLYSPIELTDEEKNELESTMAKACSAFKRASIQKYNTTSATRLCSDFRVDPKRLDAYPEAQRYMYWLERNASRILSAYIRVSTPLVLAFDAFAGDRPGVTIDDYVQEAALAITDASYAYHGGTCFSTFIYRCIKNRLISFIRKEQRASGMGAVIQKLRHKVKRIMREYACDFEIALAQVEVEGALAKTTVECLRHSMMIVKSSKVSEDMAEEHKEVESFQGMRSAVARTPLQPLERELVDAFLNGDKGLRKQLSQSRINPSTGRFYTVARLSQIFVEACGKIRQVYSELGQDAA